MKRLTWILMVVVLGTLIFTACDSSTKKEVETTKQEKESVTIQIGYENNQDEPIDVAVREWKKMIEEKSQGSIKVELFPSSQLGSKNDLIDQMLAGDAVVTIADGAFFADRGVKDLGIVFAPYLFDSWDQCWNLTESDWYKTESQKLEEKGLKLLASNWMFGERHTITSKPVRSIDDLKGMKIRVPNNTMQIKGFEVLGATPTPMSFGEVYTALQQGTIDGLENALPVLYNNKFYEVAKYLILDGHIKNFSMWVTGTDFFNSLTPEQQNILIETGKEAGLYNNNIQQKVAEETIEKMKEQGVEIIDIDKEEFKKRAKAFYSISEIASQWSDGLYDTVKEAMK